MDPSLVLKRFLELYDSRTGPQLASNAVLEFFGRTIRGKNILHYLRYHVSQQYEQTFSSASECPPFETKEAHLQTRQEPPENLERTSHLRHQPSRRVRSPSPAPSSQSDQRSLERTPPPKRRSPKLPQLTRGKHFLPVNYDEPLPSSSHEPNISGVFALGEQPRDDDDDEPVAKRLRRHRRKPATEAPSAALSSYSELRYLESDGMVKLARTSKHQVAIRSPEDVPSRSSLGFKPTDEGWARDTRLKISYRVHSVSQEVQFALIVYEHHTKNARTRRNLMSEFKEEAERTAAHKDRRRIATPRKNLRF